MPVRLTAALLTAALLSVPAAQAAEDQAPTAAENTIHENQHQATAVLTAARDLFHPDPGHRHAAIATLTDRGERDAIPALIQAHRFFENDRERIDNALRQLTSVSAERQTWHDWMLWQEAHPEVKAFPGFAAFKSEVLALIDPNFRDFVHMGVPHEIRLEEITWGGVLKDGIPALNNPELVPPRQATYLTEDELVFGVTINGDARAYPLRILDWHEMFNDVIGGVPVALAYCTLCGSGILFETQVKGREKPFVFGSSGLLYRSNKLMFDRETDSLWNQFTGRPVVGRLTGSGIALKVRPVTITSWQNWHKRHPETRVLSLNTGHARPYEPGQPYGKYFASPKLMFPALTLDKRLQPKDYVFALRDGGHEKAWPLKFFKDRAIVNDTIGDLHVVLIGDAKTRTVRAYVSEGHRFVRDEAGLRAGGKRWMETETALIDGSGKTLRRLGGHIAYWFAWSGYKPKAALATAPDRARQ